MFNKVYSIKLFLFFLLLAHQSSAQPVSFKPEISIRQIASVGSATIRIKYDKVTEHLYILENDGDIRRVNFAADSSVSFTNLYSTADHGLTGTGVLGMTFGPDGTIYLVANIVDQPNAQEGIAKIVKGITVSPGSDERTWSVLAQTEMYNYGNVYNHRMSGIIADTSGKYIYVNSGARTDHGELRQGMRETGLTSIILKLPADSTNLLLHNDREWLRTNGYLMAEGIRNDFDFALGPEGNLFSVGNSGDRNDPEEMNWIRGGHHYGFPWRIGGNNTPQQYTPYDPQSDPLLSPKAWGGGQGQLYITFSNDPSYPPTPSGVNFTEPIMNVGPDADKFQDTITGETKDASDLGITMTTFTAHRSPNGIAFDKDSLLAGEYSGGGFVLSFADGEILHDIGDSGEDLLHVILTRTDSQYTARVTRIISGFNAPLGIELVGNKVFVAETGVWGNQNPKLWQITLPKAGTVGITEQGNIPRQFELGQNYPNPFNPITTIDYQIPQEGIVTIKVYDIIGNEITTLVNEPKPAGIYQTEFSADNRSSGVYIYTIKVSSSKGELFASKKMVLLK